MNRDLTLPAALVSERMGLLFQKDRWPELARGLTKTAPTLGFDNVDALIAHLLANPVGLREVQALAAQLTVPETHFFRSPETFAMLESRLLPQLIAERRKSMRLKIWSAGCASGPEPFSVAILLSRLLPDLASWDVTVLGTDINPVALATAREAEYTQWSFRGTPAWVIAQYFTRTLDGRYHLVPAVKSMVTFRYLNLVDDVYPLEPAGINDFDLILCRNVMMYFSRETMTRVAERLQKCLRQGGYLLVSPSEVSREVQCGLRAIPDHGETIYQNSPVPSVEQRDSELGASPEIRRDIGKKGRRTVSDRPRTAARRETAGKASSKIRQGQADRPTAPGGEEHCERRSASRPWTSPARPLGAAEEARLLADRGELQEALSRCEAALETDKLDPSLYYLKASILQELGRSDEAERALQSTLFLDGNFALARVMLGAIARGQSRPGEAAKHFQAALSLLERMPSDSVLPETDGLTAGKMAETVASLIGSERVL